MVAFYQRHISAWMDGTEGLDDGEYRVYDVVCNLIYLNGGPIVLHESGIAGRCNQHPLRFRRNIQKLIQKSKIIVHDDGKISNARVISELKKIGNRKRSTAANPAPTPIPSPQGNAGVGRGSMEGKPNKPLKNKDQPLLDDSLYNTRQESLAKAKAISPPLAMINPPPDAEADLFRRGREVLGKSAGGMIKNLLISKGGNVALARAALEQASQRGDAKEYVGAMIRNNQPGRPPVVKNGYAALLIERRKQQQMGDEGDGYERGFFGEAESISDRSERRY